MALVPSETEKIKDVKESFDSLSWLFWLLLSNPRIVSPFQEKNFQHDMFLQKLGPMSELGWRKLRRKGWVSLRGIGLGTGTCGDLLGIPTI